MKIPKNTTITEYLDQKGIATRKIRKELVAACVFSACDEDSRSNEAHLYINESTGQYDCKKCGEKGNLPTLMKHFGDEFEKEVKAVVRKRASKFTAELVEECHVALLDRIRTYLNERGITDELIAAKKLGYGTFYGQSWITIPIKDISGDYAYFKLRQDPRAGNNKGTFPAKADGVDVSAQLYEWSTLEDTTGPLTICEGEFDSMLLNLNGMNAVSSTHGVGTFNEDWAKKIQSREKVYICCDNDDAGRKGAERIAKMVHEGSTTEVFIINLPDEVGKGGDVTDYFTKLHGIPEDLIGKYAHPYPERIDTSKFKPLTSEDVQKVLSLTIKHDDNNKLMAFLGQLSAYTEDSQFNISFNAPSSTGKSYIATEVAKLFPKEDVMEIAYCSPTAFFHESGNYNKEKNQYLLDLSRKIIIFIDMPHTELLARLRPLLSHDKKVIESKITDKSEKGGMRTKTVLIKGYPSVTFCTAGLKVDEQEATRFFMLSPEVNQEKIKKSIESTILKEASSGTYSEKLDEDVARAQLKERIRAIKLEGITHINIASTDRISAMFGGEKKLKPRNQRDVKRLISLIKTFALLNLWFRERKGSVVTANDEDIEAGIKLWDMISVSQEHNIPPYVYDLYMDVILVAQKGKEQATLEAEFGPVTLTRQEVLNMHYKVYGRPLNTDTLCKQILPMLKMAGLICEIQNPDDKREKLIQPVSLDQAEAVELPVEKVVDNEDSSDEVED